MPDVHEKALAFGPAAGAYERGRPSYPAEAIDFLNDRLGLGPGHVVVDLAAGTGKLTRLLLPSGATVVAVEPVAGMRKELLRRVPGVEAFEGTAESMPLPDGSADAVTVAQAFHWFDGPRALAEIRRVLRPGGALAVVWNRRDLRQPLQVSLQPIIDEQRGGAPAHATRAWQVAFSGTELFTSLELVEFPSSQLVDEEGLVDRVLSTSVVAALPDGERALVADQVRAAAVDEPRPIVLRYVTEVFVCDRRS